MTADDVVGIGVLGIDHVQLVMPVRGEAEARRFYAGLLGLREVPKPAALNGRGGCWFVGPAGTAIHLGIDDRFIAARKAHVAFLVADLGAARATLEAAGVALIEDGSEAGLRRVYVADPFGNRLELVDAADAGFTERATG